MNFRCLFLSVNVHIIGGIHYPSLVKISARSRRDWRDLGEISVILGENFSGQKISARSRRGNRDLGEISVILGVIFRGQNFQRDLAEIALISPREARSRRDF